MRSRNIKPGFFHNDDLVECSFPARLLFVGLWCLADRAGYLEDRPKKIKIQVFPADSVDCDELLNELSNSKLIRRYTGEAGKYIWIPGFRAHQNPHRREKPSGIEPHPEDIERRPDPEEKKQDQGQTKDIPRPDQGQTQDEPGTGRARLIPDILIPDSGFLNKTHQPADSDEPEGRETKPDPLERFPGEVVDFVSSFNDHIVSQWGKSAPDQTASLVANSCDTVDKLMRLDKFTLEEIRNATWWACNHDFWGRQVKSLAPLRKKGGDGTTKFQKIYDQCRAGPAKTTAPRGNFYDDFVNNACNEIMEGGYGPEGSGSDGPQIFQPEEPEG